MFTFLNSSILLGLIAASIPLIIHLITRQKVKKVLFSSLFFLRELRTQKIRRIKIRQILLLIIRTLIILLLILAFARPTLKSNLAQSIQSQAKTSAVIILDNSQSMAREIDGRKMFDLAKDRLGDFADLFNTGDELFAVTTVPGTPSIYEGAKYDIDNVLKLISRTKIEFGHTDIVSAIFEAKSILQKRQNINKEIYLISDLQENAFEGVEEFVTPILKEENIKLYVIPMNSESIDNLSVVHVEAANQIIEKGKVLELNVTVTNFGSLDVRDKMLQLFVEGKRSAQATVSLKPKESQTITFKIIPDQTGLVTGSVLLENDGLMLDNRRYFTFYVPDNIEVLIVGDKEEDIRFLNIAAAISSNFVVTQKIQEQINYNNLDSYDVILLSNVPYLQQTEISRLGNFVEQGGGLIIFLGNNVDLKSYNTLFNQKYDLPVYAETVGTLSRKSSYLTFGKIDFSHPIFRGMFDKNPEQLDSPRFFFAVKSDINPNNESIIEFSNSNPFLTETTIGKGKVLNFFTAIDPAWTDLYTKGIFVPLINRTIVYLAGVSDKTERELLTHLEIKSEFQSGDEFVNFEMQRPDGSFEKVRPTIGSGFYQINYENTDQLGIYTLYSNKNEIDKWAVNFWPGESNTKVVTDERFRDIVGDENVTYIDRTDNIINSVITARFGRELWKYFLLAALILLIIEMLIARESKSVQTS